MAARGREDRRLRNRSPDYRGGSLSRWRILQGLACFSRTGRDVSLPRNWDGLPRFIDCGDGFLFERGRGNSLAGARA